LDFVGRICLSLVCQYQIGGYQLMLLNNKTSITTDVLMVVLWQQDLLEETQLLFLLLALTLMTTFSFMRFCCGLHDITGNLCTFYMFFVTRMQCVTTCRFYSFH
jgi:hypothetical protein